MLGRGRPLFFSNQCCPHVPPVLTARLPASHCCLPRCAASSLPPCTTAGSGATPSCASSGCSTQATRWTRRCPSSCPPGWRTSGGCGGLAGWRPTGGGPTLGNGLLRLLRCRTGLWAAAPPQLARCRSLETPLTGRASLPASPLAIHWCPPPPPPPGACLQGCPPGGPGHPAKPQPEELAAAHCQPGPTGGCAGLPGRLRAAAARARQQCTTHGSAGSELCCEQQWWRRRKQRQRPSKRGRCRRGHERAAGTGAGWAAARIWGGPDGQGGGRGSSVAPQAEGRCDAGGTGAGAGSTGAAGVALACSGAVRLWWSRPGACKLAHVGISFWGQVLPTRQQSWVQSAGAGARARTYPRNMHAYIRLQRQPDRGLAVAALSGLPGHSWLASRVQQANPRRKGEPLVSVWVNYLGATPAPPAMRPMVPTD